MAMIKVRTSSNINNQLKYNKEKKEIEKVETKDKAT